MIPSDEWVAGFFDGEGSVGVYLGSGVGGGYHLKVQVVQGHTVEAWATVGSLADRFGGSISDASSRKKNRAFSWQLSGPKAAHFLTTIRPYSLLKGRQIDLALEWFQTTQCDCPARSSLGRMLPACHHRSNGEEVCRRLKAMKKERA